MRGIRTSSLDNRFIKGFVQAVVLAVCAYSIAKAVLVVSEGFTLGRFVQVLSPGLASLAIFAGIHVVEWRNSSLPSVWRGSGPKALALLALPTLLVAYFVTSFGYLGVTVLPLALISVLAVLLASLYTLTRDDFLGFVIFMGVLPIIQYLEWAFLDAVTQGGVLLGPLVLSPSIVVTGWFLLVSALSRAQPAGSGEAKASPSRLLVALIVAFVAVISFSSLASQNMVLGFREVFLNVLVIPFYFFVTGRARTENDILVVLLGQVLYCVLRLFFIHYFLVQAFGFTTLLSVGDYRQNIVWVAHQIELVSTLAAWSIPLVAALLLQRRSLARSLVLFSVLFALVIILVLSEKRSSLLALVLTVPLAFALFRRSGGWRLVVLAGILALGGIVYGGIFTPDAIDRVLIWTTSTGISSDQSMRLDAWQAAVRMMIDYPLFGIGFGMFDTKLPLYANRVFYWLGGQPMWIPSPHNLLLYYGVAAGVAAFAVVLFLVATICREAFLAYKASSSHSSHMVRVLAVALLWAISVYLLAAMVGGSVEWASSVRNTGGTFRGPMVDMGVLFWSGVGLSSAIRTFQRTQA